MLRGLIVGMIVVTPGCVKSEAERVSSHASAVADCCYKYATWGPPVDERYNGLPLENWRALSAWPDCALQPGKMRHNSPLVN